VLTEANSVQRIAHVTLIYALAAKGLIAGAKSEHRLNFEEPCEFRVFGLLLLHKSGDFSGPMVMNLFEGPTCTQCAHSEIEVIGANAVHHAILGFKEHFEAITTYEGRAKSWGFGVIKDLQQIIFEEQCYALNHFFVSGHPRKIDDNLIGIIKTAKMPKQVNDQMKSKIVKLGMEILIDEIDRLKELRDNATTTYYRERKNEDIFDAQKKLIDLVKMR